MTRPNECTLPRRGWVAWQRVPEGPWQAVARGRTEQEARQALDLVRFKGHTRDVCYLPEGSYPWDVPGGR